MSTVLRGAGASGLARSDHERLERACADLQPPFACVDLDAFDANRTDLVRRAGGTRIRLASKSVRCCALLERALEPEEISGILALTVAEAQWLADHGFQDLVVGYPSVDREALSRLIRTGAEQITVMVDAPDHLGLLEELGASAASPVNVCLEADAGLWLLGGRVRIGPRRSPLHDPTHVGAMARQIKARSGLHLRGLMAYEGQIAGVGDHPSGRLVYGAAIRRMQSISRRELRERRRELVAAAEQEAGPLQFVNAGGTGSIESSAAEPWVTEVTAGSGLFGPALFDDYTRFRPRPAAFFVLPIVRRPGRGVATALGGGYVASGPAGRDRLPRPWWPAGLRLDAQEGAGETQTPLKGAASDRLGIGDRVWMRHAKAGELCERFDRLYLIAGERIVDEVPTYRGEGRCFL